MYQIYCTYHLAGRFRQGAGPGPGLRLQGGLSHPRPSAAPPQDHGYELKEKMVDVIN